MREETRLHGKRSLVFSFYFLPGGGGGSRADRRGFAHFVSYIPYAISRLSSLEPYGGGLMWTRESTTPPSLKHNMPTVPLYSGCRKRGAHVIWSIGLLLDSKLSSYLEKELYVCLIPAWYSERQISNAHQLLHLIKLGITIARCGAWRGYNRNRSGKEEHGGGVNTRFRLWVGAEN